MKLDHVRLLNYKCFHDTGEVPIGETFTMIVGKNNSGKTAFLECLKHNSFGQNPHRVPSTAIYPVQNPIARARYGLLASGSEILHRFLSSGENWLGIQVSHGDHAHVTSLLTDIFGRPKLSFRLERAAQQGLGPAINPVHQAFTPSSSDLIAQVVATPDRQSWQYNGSAQETLSGFVGAYFENSVYLFRAERMYLASCGIDANAELNPNASNLAAVLLHLPKQAAKHDQYQ